MKFSTVLDQDTTSGALTSTSDITCSSLLAEPSRPEELIGRYAGLALADLSATCIARFHSKYTKSDGCWPWHAGKYRHFGYGMVNIGRHEDGRQINSYAHRVAYVLARGPVPAGHVVRHSCDNPGCVNPDHLIVGTQGDNNRDTVRRRRHVKVRPWLQKLTDAQVCEIRNSEELGVRLAERFGVSETAISLIRRGLRRVAA